MSQNDQRTDEPMKPAPLEADKEFRRGRSFVTTLWDPTEAEIAAIVAEVGPDKMMRYFCFGHERGQSGRHHLQGYLQTHKAMRLSGLKKVFPQRTYFSCARADLEANQAYTSKEGDWQEHGTPVRERARTDIADFLSAAETTPLLELARQYPSQYAKYHKAAADVRRARREADSAAALEASMSEQPLRQWQRWAYDRLEQQDDRKVLWIVDEKGNAGKTWLAKYIMATKKAFFMQGGKAADIAFAYNSEPYVVVDLTRDKEEVINYSVLESFKNGIIWSPKYESGYKLTPGGAKVIVFSNWKPDKSKLSEDRWDIKVLKKKPRLRRQPVRSGQSYEDEMTGRARRRRRRFNESFDFN